MIVFRADANAKIGLGHVMRCLTVANELKDKGCDSLFLCSEDSDVKKINEAGYPVRILNSSYKDINDEFMQVSELISDIKNKVIVIDHYSAAKKYFNEMKKLGKVVFFDDFGEVKVPADLLINYSISANEEFYMNMYNSLETRILIGPGYAPLRREFRNIIRVNDYSSVRRILVLTGGGDPLHVALGILKKITDEKWNNYEFGFVVGSLSRDIDEIKRIADCTENIKLYYDVKNINLLMQKSDLAISAAGNTLYELCACGVPTITYSVAENQIKDAEAFSKKHIMKNAGDARNENFFSDLMNVLWEMISDADKMQDYGNKMQQIVDGTGAANIADEIIHIACK